MSEQRDVVLSIKLPVSITVLGYVTRALTKTYGRQVYMEQNGQHLEFIHTTEKLDTVKK